MRWFIVFLIVANVILYFWVQQQSRPLPGVTTLPSPDIGRLRLKSEVEEEELLSDSETPEPPLAEAESDAIAASPVAEATVAEEPGVEMSQSAEVADTESTAGPDVVMEVEEAPDDQPIPIAPQTPESAEELITEAVEPPDSLAEETAQAEAGDVPVAAGESDGQMPAPDAPVQEPASDTPVQELASDTALEESGAPMPRAEPEDTEPVPDAAHAMNEVEQVEVEPTPAAPPSIAEVETLVCTRVGPFDSDEADELIAILPASIELLSDVSGDYARVDRYYVLIPPLPSRAAGRQKLRELADAGVTDTWLFPSGENRNAISLGYFSRERSARRHAANIAKKGFTTEVKGRTNIRKRRWLLLKEIGDNELVSSLRLPAGVRVERQVCP